MVDDTDNAEVIEGDAEFMFIISLFLVYLTTNIPISNNN